MTLPSGPTHGAPSLGVPAPLSSPYLRHLCRAPRPPTQPTPQPLLGEEEQGWTGEPKEMRAVPERAGRQSRGRLCSSQWGSAWGPRSFLSCPGKPPLGGDLSRDLQMPSWVKALVPGKGPDSGTPGQGAPWWRRIEARLGGPPGESPSSDGTGEVGTPHADLRNKGPRAPRTELGQAAQPFVNILTGEGTLLLWIPPQAGKGQGVGRAS